MSIETFYRKYRSKTFDELVGQTAIVQTLKNAIAHNRIGHAYIFSGPRGTGKTSTARIFAKTLNCHHREAPLSTQTCTHCICQKISSGHSVDVIEIDAASNTGVDHIRQLNDQVQFAPVECAYKLIIIDEVHMLSSGAFNALLKTLEEPPEKTVFILATTEPHKIPATIHSRCQTLYFRKLTLAELVGQLRYISEQESIEISDAGLSTIARNASGCMRDAISLLNQVYSFKGHTISQDDIMTILGAISQDKLMAFIAAIFSRDATKTVTILHDFFLNGVNVSQLIGDVLFLLKQAVYVSMKAGAFIDLDESLQATLSSAVGSASTRELSFWLELFAKLETDLRWFSDPELLFEARVLTSLHAAHGSGGHENLSGMSPSVSPSTGPSFAVGASVPHANPMSASSMPSVGGGAAPRSAAPAPAGVTQRPVMSIPTVLPPNSASAGARSATVTPSGSGRPLGGAMPGPSNGRTPAASDPVPVSSGRQASWSTFLDSLKAKNQGVYGILAESVVEGMSQSVIYIRLKQSFRFFKEKLKEEATQRLIQSLLHSVFGRPLRFVLLEEGESPPSEPVSVSESPMGSVSPVEMSHSNPSSSGPVATSVTGHGSVMGAIDSTPTRQLNQIIAMFEGQVL